MKLIVALLLVLAGYRAGAQDSLKTVSHELGMNVGSLLQQVKIFTVTPGGQPYDLFYNIYLRNKYGLRAGLGILTVESNTQIEGQNTPRTDIANKTNFRLGASCYVLHSKWVDLNFFVDGFLQDEELTSVNTTTVQEFPNPVVNRTTYISDRANGGGVQGGAGLRVNITKHLAFYFETAIVYSKLSHVTEDRIIETAKDEKHSKSLTTEKGARIDPPNTFYLMIKF